MTSDAARANARRRSRFARWWVNLPVRYKGLCVISLPLVGLVATVALRTPFNEQQQQTTVLLARSTDVRDRAHEMLVALLDAETGANGFLLTEDESFLDPFEVSKASVPRGLDSLRRLVAEGQERDLYEQVAQHARRRMELAQQAVMLVQQGVGLDDPELKSRLTLGKQEMDQCRGSLGVLLQTQHELVVQSQLELARIRRRLGPIVWITLVGSFVSAGGATWLFATGVARRMAALEHNAARLAQGAPLRYEPSRGQDEIGRVDRALRRAGIVIRQRNRELRSLNATLERSLHEQKVLNRELEAFSYSVSHDLRAPLRSIDGFAQALREDWGDRLDETGQDHLARVRNAAQRMGRLIDDLLKLSRLSRAQVQRIDVDLTQLAHDVTAELHERNPTRQVQWRIEAGLHANCDPSLARIILENLLGNAWKFTSKTANAQIEFVALRDTQPTTFVVRDNGAGFDMRYAEKLFAPFQRLHADRDFPGTGIGLATVQRIVHKHGGEVRTIAEIGRGATFYFTLESADGVAAA
ncbi:MAG TPA: CHASE3 domain-containing protein [Vicinamibacterales bacterium]|nr:CHASE3 domain-containing protein [Vicinamibacterales bacterium]